MKKIQASKKIYIKPSKIPEAGRGVFAKVDIKKGDTIEIAPVVELPAGDQSPATDSHLIKYLFFFGEKKERSAIALGYGSIYNHSDNPNATYSINPDKKTINFVSAKDIKRDDEITFNYRGGGYEHPLWFE